MNKFITKDTIIVCIFVFITIVQSNFFATKLDLEQLKNEMLNMKIELKKYTDDSYKELLHNLDAKYQLILDKIDEKHIK